MSAGRRLPPLNESAHSRAYLGSVAPNISARRLADGSLRFDVVLAPWSRSFDSLDEARAWRDRVARIGRRLRLVNLIRAGEAPGRL